jgi:hypothetical protein
MVPPIYDGSSDNLYLLAALLLFDLLIMSVGFRLGLSWESMSLVCFLPWQCSAIMLYASVGVQTSVLTLYSPPLQVAFRLDLNRWFAASRGLSSCSVTTVAHRASIALLLVIVWKNYLSRAPGCHNDTYSPSHSTWCFKSITGHMLTRQ